MAQRKQVTWAQLRVGLLVIVSLTIFALMVFLMTGQGFFSPKTRLKVFIDNAGGLKKGDPVRLAGIDIGNVDDIGVSSDPNPQRAVVVTFHVEDRMIKEVREDSVAALEVEGLLGTRYIDITRGSLVRPQLEPGSEVRFRPQADFGHLVASGDTVMTSVNRLANTLNEMADHAQKGQGTLGRLVYDESLYKQASSTMTKLQGMVDYATTGKGSLGQLIYSDDLYNRVNGTVGKLDGVIDDVHAQKGTLGKLIYDPSLHDDARKTLNDFDAILADARAGKGSLGKFITDDSLYTQMKDSATNLKDITGRIDRGEGTLGKLSKDETAYNNFNAVSVSIRDLLNDFHKQPKKYLTIQLKLF